MLSIIVWIAIFVISIIVLVKSAEYFTRSAETIGLYFGMPAFIVGVTIISIGSSLPELLVSLVAIFRQSSEIVIGNVVGSNITNIFLVLGLAAILGKNLVVARELIHVDLPFLIGSALLLTITIWDGIFTRGEAVICLLVMLVYLSYTIHSEKSEKELKKEIKGEVERKLKLSTITVLLISIVFLYISSRYTVESLIQMSDFFHVGKELIAIGAVALGTSLPELIVSINAALKGKEAIAIGTVLGSNIFNSLAVMGISGLIGAITIPTSILAFGLPLMVIATVIYLIVALNNRITAWEGWMLFLFYVLFVAKIYGFF